MDHSMEPNLETHETRSPEIPNTEEDSEDGNQYKREDLSRTELENAHPSVESDQEAIAEYESTRFRAEDTVGHGKFSLEKGSWPQGRSSIYVDAFNFALDAVLDDESHLFSEIEHAVFDHWRALSYDAKYLSVALSQ